MECVNSRNCAVIIYSQYIPIPSHHVVYLKFTSVTCSLHLSKAEGKRKKPAQDFNSPLEFYCSVYRNALEMQNVFLKYEFVAFFT